MKSSLRYSYTGWSRAYFLAAAALLHGPATRGAGSMLTLAANGKEREPWDVPLGGGMTRREGNYVLLLNRKHLESEEVVNDSKRWRMRREKGRTCSYQDVSRHDAYPGPWSLLLAAVVLLVDVFLALVDISHVAMMRVTVLDMGVRYPYHGSNAFAAPMPTEETAWTKEWLSRALITTFEC